MKNKYVKKALSMFLVVCILITMLPLTAQAEETATFYLCVSWVIDDTGYIIDSELLEGADVTLTNDYDDSIVYTGTTVGYAVDGSNWMQSGIPSGFYTLKVTYEGNEYIDENIYLRTFANVSFNMNRDESPEPQYWAITEEDTTGGYVRVGAESTPAGFETYCHEEDTLNVYINVSSGYRLVSLKYNDATYFTESTQEWETTSELEVPAGSDYEYKTSFPMPGFNITVTAEFEGIPEECTVTYDVQEDDVQDAPEAETVDYDELITEPSPEPSLDGYVFGGWYTDENCTGGNEWVFDEDTLTSDTTLYAKWIKLCTVTFLLWDGETWDEYTEIMEWEKISAPEEPMRDGHLFAGWYTDEDCSDGNEWDFDTDMVEDDLNLYSKWIVGWTVMFVDWDGTVLEKYEVEDGEASPSPGDPVREGYTFTGWDADFSCVTSNLEVNAEYEINRYTVIFRDWNGTILKTQENIPYYSYATAPADPARAGYRFSGWDTDFSCVTSDLTVTAQYVLTHTVTFDSQGGSTVDNQIVDHGGKADLPAPAPTKTGYTLGGWYKEAGCLSQWDFNTETVTKDITLYAQWIANGSSDGGNGGGSDSGSEDITVVAAISIDKQTITTPAGQTFENYTVQVGASTQIEAAKAEGKTSVKFNIENSQTSVIGVNIPVTILESAAGMNVSIGTPHATLELPVALVEALAAAGKDFSVTVERGGEVANPQDTTVLGTPTIISTAVIGTTQVTIPLEGISTPADPQAREAFLSSLAVFTYHSDGETELITGEIVYDAGGNLVSITFPVEKFSTFALVKLNKKTVILTIGQDSARINGIPLNLDASPFIDVKSNRALASQKFVSEALGAKVDWNPTVRQVNVKDGEMEIILTIGATEALINGVNTQIDCAPALDSPGRAYLPVRFISEILKAEVVYDNAAKQIKIVRKYDN